MRVLVAIAEMGIGGAEAVVESVANSLLADADEVAVASSGGFRADRLAARGARLVPVPMAGRERLDLIRSIRALRRELRSLPPDLVHVHNVKAAALVRIASLGRRGSRAPTLVTLHGVPDREYAAAARILRRCADHVVAVSADIAERIVSAGLPAGRVSVVPNAVQAPERHPRDQARARLNLDPTVPVAVCLARLVEQKRHDVLVEAWRSVPAEAVLLVAGDGPKRAQLTDRIAAAGLGDRIRMLGARTDVDWLLAAADVSVLSTDWEGLPISILEAMAAGVPVVASAVGGLPATLAGAAVLVEPQSSAALAAGLIEVLTDAGRREQLRTAAQTLVSRDFGVERMEAAYRAEYARLLG